MLEVHLCIAMYLYVHDMYICMFVHTYMYECMYIHMYVCMFFNVCMHLCAMNSIVRIIDKFNLT